MPSRPFAAGRFIAACKSWKEFHQRAAALSPDRQAEAFRRLAVLHLQTSPLYRNLIDPNDIWPVGDAPAAVRRRLKSGGSGMDLVARTRDGSIWAVKTDFVAPGGPGPGRAAATALAEAAFAAGRGVTHALFVHSGAEDVAPADTRVGELGLAAWSGLGKIAWRRISAAAVGRRVGRTKAKRPRPHQRRAVADALAHFAVEERGRLVMPCGTGKSLIAILIAEALSARTVIVAVPSLALIRQSLAGWAEHFDAAGRSFDCLCVCSDDTVADGGDDPAESVSSLGIEVTTSVAAVAAHLRLPRKRPLIVFSTYQSSSVLAAGARKAKFAFDLAVLDEAHKTVGAADRAFATLLDQRLIAVGKRLSMTATERVYRGEREDVLSMDDESVYGRCFHQLSFKAAVEQKLICDYRIITFFVGESEIRELIEKNATLRVGHDGREALSDADAQSLAAGIALKRVIRDYGVRHTISFHRSIRAADRFRDQQDLLDHLDRRLGPRSLNLHVSGRFSTAARADIMDRFAAAEIGCVSNARCLTEGVDVPRTDCILFEDAKQSVIDIAQAAGRAMRLFPGKEFGYVLVPVVVPEGISFDDFAATTQFRKIAQTLTAMSTQDERLVVEFRRLASGVRRPAGGGIARLDGLGAAVGMDLATFGNSINARVWSAIGRANWRPFEQARAYVRSLGLKSVTEWSDFIRSGKKPADIPSAAPRIYAGRGWTHWRDFLGTEKAPYRSFEEARIYARSLGLRTSRDWIAFTKTGRKPDDIPGSPQVIYAGEGWRGYPDFLAGRSWRNYRPFEEARAYVRSLGLRTPGEWRAFAASGRKPDFIPNSPNLVYSDSGWAGYWDWIGSEPAQWRPFEEARAYVRSLGLRGAKGWKDFADSDRRPRDIPKVPKLVYAGKGWIDLDDFLGTSGRTGFLGTSGPRKTWRPFEEARAYVRSLGLKTTREWGEFAKSGRKPKDIPANPSSVYAGEGWSGFTDWLTGKTWRTYRPFEEARAYVRSLGFAAASDWYAFAKSGRKPADIPSAPDQVYADSGWAGYVDWLKGQRYRPFEEARAYVHKLGLKTGREWIEFNKSGKGLPDIPSYPRTGYPGEFANWSDWLGTIRKPKGQWRPFGRARAYARGLGFRNVKEWQAFVKTDGRPADIPTHPNRAYAGKGWKDWLDWLGKKSSS